MFKIKNKIMGIPVALSLLAMAGSVGAQTIAPRVSIQLLNTGLTTPLIASSADAVIARLVLDTNGSSEAVRISSIPFILTARNGGNPSTLTNCRVTNDAVSNSSLNVAPGSSVGMVSGLNTINLSSPLVLSAGTVTTLSLRCDPSAGLVTGGNFTVSMNTANLSATGVNTGLPAVVGIRGAVSLPIPVPVPVPGLPNTGAGGEAAMNIALLLGSLGLIGLGAAYIKTGAKQVR